MPISWSRSREFWPRPTRITGPTKPNGRPIPPHVKSVAKITGAKPEDVPAAIALYRFPTLKEQASKSWLGGGKDGGAAQSLQATANFLKSQGTIASMLARLLGRRQFKLRAKGR